MNFLELSAKRHSVRSYADRAVEQQKIDYILECARMAPSAMNFQPWHFMVVRSDKQRRLLQQCYDRKWFASAPVYIVVLADTSVSWKRECDGKEHADIDAAIAAEHICLAATESGLGSCWVCNFDMAKCREVLCLPDSMHPVVIIPTGYAAEQNIPAKNRKDPGQIISTI